MPDRPKEPGLMLSRLDEAFWRGLFDIHLDALAFIDSDYRIIRANLALADALGCRAEELTGRPCHEVFHGTGCPVADCPHTQLLRDGCEHANEQILTRLRGCFWISVTPVFDDSGLLLGCLHIARNVTDYKTLEAELRTARDEVEVRADARTRELKEHLQFEQLLVTLALSLGRSLSETELHSIIQAGVGSIAATGGFGRCVFWQIFAEDARVIARHEEASHLLPPMPDQTTRASDAWLFSVLGDVGMREMDDAGVERCVVGIPPLWANDAAYALVAERRTAQSVTRMALSGERLRLLCDVMGNALRRWAGALEAQRLREDLTRLDQVARMGQLSAVLAHELNQPLAATLCNAQAAARLLNMTPPDVAETRSALDDIVANARRAGDVMRQTRALFKGGSQPSQPLDTQVLIAAVLKLMRDDIALAGAEVTCICERPLPPVLGDMVQLQQVMINLIRNALEAMRDASGRRRGITVTSGLDQNGAVQISVTDTGKGIAEGEEDLIFTPFRTEKPDGMGVGLSICRQIIKHHGGEICAVRVPSGGTSLVVTLPTCRD